VFDEVKTKFIIKNTTQEKERNSLSQLFDNLLKSKI